jgi:hypothetical protein
MKAAPVVINSNLAKSDADALVTFHVTKTGVAIRMVNSVECRGLQVDLANVLSTPETINSQFSNANINKLAGNILRVVLLDDNGQTTLAPGNHIVAEIPMTISDPSAVRAQKLVVGGMNGEALSIESETSLKQAPELPVEFSLKQNYPNPFNPGTQIDFSIPQTSQVRITIYNMLGQEVRTLFAGQMKRGSQTLPFDGKDASGKSLSSGIYLCRMQAGTFDETKKMMLVK